MRKFLLILLFLIIMFFGYFLIGRTKPAQKISWGVNFSQKHTENFGLDWKETYSALLDDLSVKSIKVAVHWDLIEPEKDGFAFEDLDWQIKRAKEKEAKVLLVIGMKTPRWPECHIPTWAAEIGKVDQQERILNMIEEIVLRYEKEDTISSWQVENEPFFHFGECPWHDEDFLKKEIKLVKSLDSKDRPVIISDSGEYSFWTRAAKIGDAVGITMYRRVWFHNIKRYITYPFPAIFYQRRAAIIKKVFRKEVICVELQAEPWGPELLYTSPITEQEKTMNLKQFKKNVEFAKKTGLKEFYLWGAEWWYWMKEKQNRPEIWEQAKELFI